MRQLVICWGSGIIISIFVVFLSINYSHNASIGSLTVLLSLPLLPASAIYTLVTSAGEPGWPLYALMIAFGSVFYSLVNKICGRFPAPGACRESGREPVR